MNTKIICFDFDCKNNDQEHGCLCSEVKILNKKCKSSLKKIEKNWFGYNCKFLCGQWERGDSRKQEPVLNYCAHDDNPENYEGNCREDVCPLRKEG